MPTEYDATVDWNHQYVTFMDRYKLWKPELFQGRQMSGKEFHSFFKEYQNKEHSKFNWNQWCYNLLRREIHKYNKNTSQPLVWAEGKDKYPYKTHITLNLPDTRTLTDAVECASRLVTACKWIKYAEYTPEYYTATGGHPHIHMIVMTDNNRYKSLSNVINALKKQKENKWAVACLGDYLPNLQSLKVTAYNKNTDNYLDGIKTDKKMDQVELDNAMRNQLGLENKYIYEKTT